MMSNETAEVTLSVFGAPKVGKSGMLKCVMLVYSLHLSVVW